MTQEIQLSLSQPAQPPAPAGGSWSAPVSTALAPIQPQQTALATVHSHLRGRYVVTIILAVVFAAVGAGLGWKMFRPTYQSTGLIEIRPVIISPEMADRIMPLYGQYITTVMANLHSERVARLAMSTPEWQARRPLPAEAYLNDWNKNLLVKVLPNSYDVMVTYTDDSADAKAICPIAVRSAIKAYTNLYGDEQRLETKRKIDVWNRRAENLTQQITRNRALIDQLLQNIGENPQMVLDERWREHILLQQKLHELEEELKREKGQLATAQELSEKNPYSVEDLARVDPAMEEMYHIRTQLELEVQEYETRLGQNNPATKAARERLNVRTQQINKYRDELRAKYFIMPKPDGTGNFLVSRDLSNKEAAIARMRDLDASQQAVIDDLGRRSHQVTFLRTQTQQYEDALVDHHKHLNDLQSEEEMAETFRVIDEASSPSMAGDKRIAFGGLGLMAGAGLPVCLLLLASLMNPRFRFSDEATGQANNTGLTLLGILPDLPDRLSDPEQASIAAHCVHQIRTMLQINTGLDDRRVFAITSAAPGDGKTSLTLALGLSYAACGTRTLLIDCDLIGAGLTTRMNVSAEEGVLEAIASRSLLEYVRSTDIADVSILPVGTSHQLHASTLSPAALRRLIEEARKQFDTILIDTGPVLGSIEASLVAAAADAVVLAVSRGQQRPLVEKTIQHLKHIKANLAGVVFNRAQNADFDRSISGLSLRSAAAGAGHNRSNRIGPVARAVQSAFKPAGEEEVG